MKHSRRSFLSTVLALPVAAALPRNLPGLLHLADDHGSPFTRPDVIRYDSSCFTIRGADAFVFSMECPYPRIPRELWSDRFLKIKQAGFNTIDSYVFWNYHEREPGRFDFSELEEFLELAHQNGFWVIVRPGPYVDAEFERGGFPYWIIAKRFPVRSMHPESLSTSKYWYDHVLPVIRRYQITQGGPVIMMQIENELDFTNFAAAEQREYIRFLARTAWDAGIEVPLITNVTTVVRDRSDLDMVRIIDTCDFYPRWSFLVDREITPLPPGATLEDKVAQSDRAVLASLRKLRKDEPDCPLCVAELGTGYYSKFGGKLAEDEEGVDAAEINAFTKTVLEQGVTYCNYYLGCGGTNYEWAAKGVTTTYDFAAPIREWGGLWGKYYAIRGVGAFLGMFGGLLTRSQAAENACHSTHPDLSVSQRVSGQSAFVFVRANTEAEHHFKLTFRDPASAAGRSFTVPREGEIYLGPHAMKILAVQVPIAGGRLRYSTAEVLAHGKSGDRSFLVIYDEPGSLVEVALEAGQEPHIVGETVYQAWDLKLQTVVLGLRISQSASFLLVNDRLQIIALPGEIALRTWVEDFPISGAGVSGSIRIPFITDAYLLAAAGWERNRIWTDIDLLPGPHSVSVLLPSKPALCRVDGSPKMLEYDPQFRTGTLSISTAAVPAKAVEIREVQISVERFDTSVGSWITTPARALEELGPIPYGYVKYRAEINFNNQPKMYISAFTNDGKKVFVNGKLVPEASRAEKFVEFATAAYFNPGANRLEISYELFGSTEFGDEVQMSELKGISSVRLSADPSSTAVEKWQVQCFPAARRGRTVDPDFSFGAWTTVGLGGAAGSELLPAFAWCRAEFGLAKHEGWSIPWKVVFEAERDALLYLNGKFVGRYVTVGPQTEFYLPEPHLHFGSEKNILTIVLAYAETPGAIKTISVEPYADYCARRTRVELEW
jgi:hypothetical protein